MAWASSCQNGLRWRVGCAPSQENQNINEPGCPEGRMATGSFQLRRTLLPRNVHLASPQPNATGHVEIAERPSSWNSVLDDPIILPDTVGTCSLPGPSPTSPFPSFALDQAPSVGVAVHSTPLATTVQLAHGQECWRGGASHWKAQLQECAERQGGAWPRTSSCETWTWESRMPTTTDAWRLWPTVCHSSVACSLLWTSLWCLHFRVMANRRGELSTGMVWHSNGLEEGNNIPWTRATRQSGAPGGGWPMVAGRSRL